jgi:hypothetical protein
MILLLTLLYIDMLSADPDGFEAGEEDGGLKLVPGSHLICFVTPLAAAAGSLMRSSRLGG